MFLICLLLIGFLVVTYLNEQGFLTVESGELIPVKVKVDELESRERKHLRR